MPFIPAWFDDMDLSPRQVRIATRIARRGDCYESARSMATHCRIGRNAVLIEIKKLVEIGLVKELRDGNGRRFCRLQQPAQNGTIQCQDEENQLAPESATSGTIQCMPGTIRCQSGTGEIPKGTTPFKVLPLREEVPREKPSKKMIPIKLEKTAWGEVFALDWPEGFKDRKDFGEIFKTWVEFRVKKKKLTQTPAQFFGRQLKQMESWGVDGAIESIGASLGGEWQGLFAPKPNGKTSSPSLSQKKFKRPELDDLRKAFEGKGLSSIEALDQSESFQAYHDSKGWVVGKVQMKDWKGAVVTWIKNQKKWNKENGNTRNEVEPVRGQGF